jgi:predicted transcriptional regulator
LADCTFKPHINKSRNKSVRNIKEFLDSQQQHLQRIEDKKQEIERQVKEEHSKHNTFSPHINKKKQQKNKENVYTRLYKGKDKEKEFRMTEIDEKFQHIPQITPRAGRQVRTRPVQ